MECGDLGCTGLANQKERWLRRLSCHREERSDLAFPKSANGQKRDCRAALAMTRCVIARIVAISVVWGLQTKRRDCFAGYPVIARTEAISPFLSQQTDKRWIAALRS